MRNGRDNMPAWPALGGAVAQQPQQGDYSPGWGGMFGPQAAPVWLSLASGMLSPGNDIGAGMGQGFQQAAPYVQSIAERRRQIDALRQMRAAGALDGNNPAQNALLNAYPGSAPELLGSRLFPAPPAPMSQYQQQSLDLERQRIDKERPSKFAVNPITGGLYDTRTGEPFQQQGGAAADDIPTGPDYLTYLEKTGGADRARELRGYMSGQATLPQRMRSTPAGMRLMNELWRIDPNFSPNVADNRAKIFQELNDPKTVGSLGWRSEAVNNASGHLNHLWDMAPNLPTTDGLLSYPSNLATTAIARGNNDPVLSEWDSTLNSAAPEVSKFVSGKAPAEGEIIENRADFSANKGKIGSRAAIKAKMELFRQNIQQMVQDYRNTMKEYADPNMKFVRPDIEAVIGKITGKNLLDDSPYTAGAKEAAPDKAGFIEYKTIDGKKYGKTSSGDWHDVGAP